MTKSQSEPTIDGVPICEIIELGISKEVSNEPAYQRIERTSLVEVRKRFTVFVGFGEPTRTYDSQGIETIEWPSIEEIDVNAVDDTEAFILAELALAWHYEPGGKIIAATERWGMYY